MNQPRQSCLRALAPLCFATILLGATAQDTTLINGRKIQPVGDTLRLAPFPFTFAVSPDGQQLVAPSIGFPFALNVVARPAESGRSVQLIRNEKTSGKSVEALTGVAYSPDGELLYVGTGNSGAVDVLSTRDWHRIAHVSLDGLLEHKVYKESFAANLVLSADGRLLYVLDQGNWRVVVIDTGTMARVACVSTGVNPLAIALAPDDRHLYVTNSGLFEYKLIAAKAGEADARTGLRFPPSGYPSRSAREGSVIDGHAVPGLGDENDPRGSSLWTYRLASTKVPVISACLRLGEHITEKPKGVVGGASPSGVVASAEHVYVTLAHTDQVAVVSPDGARLERAVVLSPFAAMTDRSGRALRGIAPQGMALAPRRLYVAESGIDAVAVIDTDTNTVLGHVPTGWYPTAVTVVSSAGKAAQLLVLNNKGAGAGPNVINGERRYIGQLEYGSLQVLPLAGLESRLESLTHEVVANNRAALESVTPLPEIPVQHIFLIIRENRTFDEILGDLAGANGEASLARYGEHGWANEEKIPRDLDVTPNAHSLARLFATSDHFSTDSDVSADGHRWAVGIAPTPWMNIAWTSNYGGRRTEKLDTDTPGRRALSGGNDGPMPEDEPEFGSMWEHVAGAGLHLFNYGEGLELEGNDEGQDMEPEGQRLYLNSPLPKPVFDSSDRKFPTFNLGIPDQLRFDEFSRDFKRRLASGEPLASLIVIRLPGDHTSAPRSADGYPYKASFVADNDLALGKIVDLISHSRVWSNSAIFAIEDDAQDGADHVDAHRSVVLAAGPYIRRGYISHHISSMVSLQKTIYELLNVGSLNLEDGLSAGLADLFTMTPDFTPYQFKPSDLRVFNPAKARIARPKSAAEARALLDCDDAREIEKDFRARDEEAFP